MPQSGSGSTWLSVDPLANKYPRWIPYNYVGDDPSLLVDLNGMNPGDNNNQGSQSSSNWNWQFGPNGTYVLFNAGSSSQQQPTVTVAGPQEVPLAPNGFAETQTNPASHLLSLGANILSGTSSALTGIGAGLVVGGLFTEGSTIPEGALTLQMASYAEFGSVTLEYLNYKIYNVGNPNEIYGKAMQVGFDIAFSKFGEVALDKTAASEMQKGETEILGLTSGIGSFLSGPSNPNSEAYNLGFRYVYPDVTANSVRGW